MTAKIIRLFSLLLLFGFISLGYADAQDIPSNLQSLNVDELSDAQIGKMIKQFEEGGYSEQQVEVLARARGASEVQITKLRQRISSYKSSRGDSGSIDEIDRSRENSSEVTLDPFSNLNTSKKGDRVDGMPIFGQSFFQNKNLTFQPSLNVPTPKDYQLGAGDEIIIDVWGASEQNYQLTISPEGSVVIPNIGPVYLNGLSMEKAEARIKSRLKSIYSTLGNNTFAQVNLGKLRTISINVIGEVNRPGTYETSSFATAFNALYLAGGPSANGSFREIKIFRSGKLVANLDTYQFLVFGKGQNIKLQDQDLILVKPYISRILLAGELKRPAIYELKADESFTNLLEFAGGFSSEAYKKSVSIQRNLANGKTVRTISSDDFPNFFFQDGDKIDVGAIQNNFIDRIRVEGAVYHPGAFELEEGMKLSEAIAIADGFRDDVFLDRAIIIRQNPDLTLTSIAFSPKEVLNGNYDLELRSEDVIKIQSISDLKEDFSVTIQGEVQSVGTYVYTDGMSVEDLIYLSDGFKETAARSFVEVSRRIVSATGNESLKSELFNLPINENLTLSAESEQFELKPFDLVTIRKSPFYEKQRIVEIEGEVLYPGKYALSTSTERISDIIKRAGGFTVDAYPKGGSLIRRTEYADDSEASKVKRLRLEGLEKIDSTAVEGTFSINSSESIAIELDLIGKNPGSTKDLILESGDIISVPKELQTVRIRGEVYFPNNIIYENKLSFKEYVIRAGGKTSDSKINKGYVIYPNGGAKVVRNFLFFKTYPKIQPGSEIIVPRRPDRRKLSPQEIIGITSGIGTIALIINNLTTK